MRRTNKVSDDTPRIPKVAICHGTPQFYGVSQVPPGGSSGPRCRAQTTLTVRSRSLEVSKALALCGGGVPRTQRR